MFSWLSQWTFGFTFVRTFLHKFVRDYNFSENPHIIIFRFFYVEKWKVTFSLFVENSKMCQKSSKMFKKNNNTFKWKNPPFTLPTHLMTSLYPHWNILKCLKRSFFAFFQEKNVNYLFYYSFSWNMVGRVEIEVCGLLP